MVAGTTPDGAQAVTVLLFTEGRAVAIIEFGSGPDDPVAPQVVTDVGQTQNSAIKNNLSMHFSNR
jgi:hypothetical protein